jgi:hypothetical protein
MQCPEEVWSGIKQCVAYDRHCGPVCQMTGGKKC